ncbi:MAG: hypothetical protein IT458_07235 [Planctomycetes bacterium]|nr:hypothetical protein [Planctomycetota bacterium]
MIRARSHALLLVALAALLPAQAPEFRATPAVLPGGRLDLAVLGAPNQPYVLLADADGGPVRALGQTLFLGLTPACTAFDSGVLGPLGLVQRAIPVPASVAGGSTFYLQAVVVDPAAPSGLRVSDGESTIVRRQPRGIVGDLLDPVLEGYTGTFDRQVRGRLQAMPGTTRVQRVLPAGGVPFGQPVSGPLAPHGVRIQMVYRAADLGANGLPEELVAIRWLPFGAVSDDVYGRLQLSVSHSTVVPDYTIDPWSALPMYPNSGLGPQFAANVKPLEVPTVVHDGQYAIRASDRRADGFMPYPMNRDAFFYNGFDSLLLDFRMVPDSRTRGVNGQQVHLMVMSSPDPNSRVYAAGAAGAPLDPFAVTTAQRGDNSLHEIQLEFAQRRSAALTPWMDSGLPAPNYDPAIVASSVPAGASIGIEYRGADTAQGANPTPWSTISWMAAGKRYLQLRFLFVSGTAAGAMPSVDGFLVPVR